MHFSLFPPTLVVGKSLHALTVSNTPPVEALRGVHDGGAISHESQAQEDAFFCLALAKWFNGLVVILS